MVLPSPHMAVAMGLLPLLWEVDGHTSYVISVCWHFTNYSTSFVIAVVSLLYFSNIGVG